MCGSIHTSLLDLRKINFTIKFPGIQGELWSETTRTSSQFHSMILPRLLALAERAWHKVINLSPKYNRVSSFTFELYLSSTVIAISDLMLDIFGLVIIGTRKSS